MGSMKPGNRQSKADRVSGSSTSKLSSLNARSSKGNLSWGIINERLLLDALAAATEGGAALLLGKTSDGGALVIHVLDGMEKVKEYPSTQEDAHAFLNAVERLYNGNALD